MDPLLSKGTQRRKNILQVLKQCHNKYTYYWIINNQDSVEKWWNVYVWHSYKVNRNYQYKIKIG